MKKHLVFVFVLLLVCALTACTLAPAQSKSSDATDDSGAIESGDTDPVGPLGGRVPEGGIVGGKVLPDYVRKEGATYDAMSAIDGYIPSAPVEEGADTNSTPRAGVLTACAYDDHEFDAYWRGLLTSTQEGPGKFAEYFNRFAFKAFYQVQVTVEGVVGAKVKLVQNDSTLSSAITDNAGIAYVFAPERPTDAKVVVEVPLAAGGALTLEKAVEGNTVTFDQDASP